VKNYNLFLEQQAAFKTGELEGEAAEEFALQSLRKALIYATNPETEEDIAYEEFLLQKAKQEHQAKAVARRRRMQFSIGIAASFLLIVGFWQLKTTEQTPQNLWLPLILDNIKMDATPTAEDKLKQADTFYKNKQFAEALPLYEVFIQQNAAPTEAVAHVQVAECYAQQTTPDYKKAIDYLLKAQQIDPLYRQKEVAWHLALAYYFDGQKEKAKAAFQQIQGKYEAKARELLSKM
jgi:tetratricopeptide (TPR) repeat protein